MKDHDILYTSCESDCIHCGVNSCDCDYHRYIYDIFFTSKYISYLDNSLFFIFFVIELGYKRKKNYLNYLKIKKRLVYN